MAMNEKTMVVNTLIGMNGELVRFVLNQGW